MHGAKRTRLSTYGINLRAKKAFAVEYILLDKHLSRYHKEAIRQMRTLRKQGKPASYNLLALLESRLDRVVYQMGAASTPSEARQLVLHKKVSLNGKVCNKRRAEIKPGDTITVSFEKTHNFITSPAGLEQAKKRPEKPWISNLHEELKGSFVILQATYNRAPKLEELPSLQREEQDKIVVFYSK
jgi:small subunit ribosomal protein S4